VPQGGVDAEDGTHAPIMARTPVLPSHGFFLTPPAAAAVMPH
jgi:hypothetical protein